MHVCCRKIKITRHAILEWKERGGIADAILEIRAVSRTAGVGDRVREWSVYCLL